MSPDDSEVVATISDGASMGPTKLLARALDRSGFWGMLGGISTEAAVAPGLLRFVIKPDLLAFAPSSPTATDPTLVEALIDLLHDRGYPQVSVVASTDTSSLWAENRDVLAVADLLGYRFATPRGRSYDVLDLGEDAIPAGFPEGALLHDSSISRFWMDAHVRIVFAKNKTDEAEGYALCVDSLIGILPLADKDYFYRHRCNPGIIALEILRTAPPQFALIDAIVSSHRSGGLRAPSAIATGTLIASASPILADFAGALKMGVDPYISRINATVMKSYGLPSRYRLDGNLAVYPGWSTVQPVIVDAVRKRDTWVGVSRSVKPWLQRTDEASFPLKTPLDARANELLAARFASIDDDPGAFIMYLLANYGLAWINEFIGGYRILNAKDEIRRRHVPLGIDPATFDLKEYESTLQELQQLRELLRDLPFDANRLRWRYVNEAVVFEISRTFPVPFQEFVSAIDVAKTIQFMNDYLGGVMVVVQRDSDNRVTHQAERNLYLPQPNYLAFARGAVIDVTKLEYVDYSDEQHRMCWKTVKSENASAEYDDGVVTFTRKGNETLATIFGRQRFALPPFWQAVNLDLAPSFKAELVTNAYSTFFQRTFSNFEALLEGRDIYMGRPWHDPDKISGTEPLLTETIGKRVIEFIEKHGPEIAQAFQPSAAPSSLRIDSLGFKHFDPQAPGSSSHSSSGEKTQSEDTLARQWSQFWSELVQTVRRDAEWQLRGPLESR
jgi:uncharacterized protein (DUF362 family)